MSLLIPDTGLLIWMLLCFLVVFFVLAKYGFPVITKMVEGRKAYIDESLEKAREANTRLANLQQEGEKILSDARAQQAQILQEAVKARTEIVARAKEQAAIESGKMIEDAKRQINQEKEDALHDIRRQVAELSVGIAEKVIRKQIADKEGQMDMIDRLVDEAITSNS